MVSKENAAKSTIRIISVLNAYYRHITKIMRIACVLKAYWANMLPLICSSRTVSCYYPLYPYHHSYSFARCFDSVLVILISSSNDGNRTLSVTVKTEGGWTHMGQ